MPIITVSHKDSAPQPMLEALRRELPAIVSEAIDCPEEPYDGRLRPGDVNLRFVAALPPDEGLDYLVEIRTRWTQSRSENLQERTDRVQIALEKLDLERFGVWIELPQAGWAQASPRVTP
jgi:hypothetical protein